MATNPMKRREHNAFLIGFIIALLAMAVVVFFIFMKYNEKKDELENLQRQQKTVIVAKEDIDSGSALDEKKFTQTRIMTNIDSKEYFTNVKTLLGNPIIYQDQKGNEPEMVDTDEDGVPDKVVEQKKDEQEVKYGVAAKIKIPKGSIITKNMLMKTEDALTDDVRLQEYNTFVLPSELVNGDFIDIRLVLPNGQDYIVVSKKEVIHTNETTVWLKMNELEILMLDSAMVDAWTIDGSKLYAVEYVDPGMQEGATITYQPSEDVTRLINIDTNIVKEAKSGLKAALEVTGKDAKMSDYREYINEMFDIYKEQSAKKVENGFKDDTQKIQTHRNEYVKSLKGTDKIGSSSVTTSSSNTTTTKTTSSGSATKTTSSSKK